MSLCVGVGEVDRDSFILSPPDSASRSCPSGSTDVPSELKTTRNVTEHNVKPASSVLQLQLHPPSKVPERNQKVEKKNKYFC